MTKQAFFPVVSLAILLLYGLAFRPFVLGEAAIPLEIIFLTASIVSVSQLLYLGFSWDEIQNAMIGKIRRGLPAIFILFSIGVVIGSWIVSGTIPMLIYFGIKTIDPQMIYLVAFGVSSLFSMLTGTSWGSAGTIGVVVMGIAGVIEANLAITAGAVVGGSYLGDKLSPLSDTTNVAALSAEVNLYDHIRSMLNTTVPAAALAAFVYAALGFFEPPASTVASTPAVEETLLALKNIFVFSPLLLIPVAIVLFGAATRKPTVPVLILSSFSAAALALGVQRFSSAAVIETLYKGFDISMAPWNASPPPNVIAILNRGGLYELGDPIIITVMVFSFIGSLEVINAMPRVVDRIFKFARTKAMIILSALAATAATNALTSNQFATSFIIGDAFKSKFDALRVPRKVLSRSLEDTGTMLENLLPWTTTGVYMAATLGVSVGDYWHWQFLSLFNFIIAPSLALLGIGCFYHEVSGPGEAGDSS